jgi:hypothetical protein
MKRCPECQRTYADETLTYCLADGTLLSAPYDPNATLQIPPPRSTKLTPTEVSTPQPPRSAPASGGKPLLLYLCIALAALIVGGGTIVWLKSGVISSSATSTSTPEKTVGKKEQQAMPPTSMTPGKSPDISGEWNGIATSGDKTLLFKMIFSQSGESVGGTIRMSSYDKAYYAVIKIKGETSDNRLDYAGTEVLENVPFPNGYWCLHKARLQYSRPNGIETLEGTWGSNDVSGGCPKGSHGDIKVTR